MSDNFNYDTFVRNPPNPVDIYNFSEHESSNFSPIPNSFNISSFNVNGLRKNGQVKIEQISNFFNIKHISFGGIDNTKQVHSSGGISLFIDNALASHVQDFISHSSQILSALSTVMIRLLALIMFGLVPCLKDLLLPLIFLMRKISALLITIPSSRTLIIHFWLHPSRLLVLNSFNTKPVTSSNLIQSPLNSGNPFDSLCDIPPSIFSSWHINQQCKYLHSHIVKAANASLPSVMVGNHYTPTVPKDLEALTQDYCFLSRLLHLIRLLRKYPSTYYNRYERTWSTHFIQLQRILAFYKKVIPTPPALPTFFFIHIALHGLLLLKEKDFQDSSIRAKLDNRDNNFETDISSFINSALSRTR
ncbi:hypothetical protein RhiirA5_413452 [Rhizophagus irregularis]|uniref:Uncharacterized protein n=1 Tax=Rhizophagus irregularis TaxID=588596 RepID=A0A2N0PWC8_9GLOM|nr:hypothetical protein RhiirA5_413452 [Rhizophagus irregularis]